MILWSILAFVVGFLGMEFTAWATHKYVMHGWLWSLHRDHHEPTEGHFERNDWFAVFFSSPAILLMTLTGGPGQAWFWLGAGITGYGLAYVIFHDIIVHRRIKVTYRPRTRYMKRLIRAHKVHHKTLGKYHAEAFGFLWAPRRYDPR
jgi:beta-carotene 3-hydroxylase